MRNCSMNHRLKEAGWGGRIRGLVALVACTASLAGGLTNAEVVLIAHSSVPDSELTGDDVRNIFLGDKSQWSNGERVALAMPRSSDARDIFLRAYINRTDAQFKNHWRRIVFTGRWQMPKEFANEEELVRYVGSTPGAVTFVSDENSAKNGTKAISVK